MPSASLVQWIAISIGTWFAWKVLKGFVVKHPLAHIRGPPSNSWIAGSILPMLDPLTRPPHLDELVSKFGGLFMFRGLFGDYCLHINDPKALHHVIVKDRDTFEESRDLILSSGLVFGEGLLATVGEKHKKQRKVMNPVFSVVYLREMLPTFYSVVHKLRQSLTQLVEADGNKEIDLYPWMTRASLEIIAQGGFGRSIDSLEVGAPEHPFAASLKRLSGALAHPVFAPLRILFLPSLINIGPAWFRRAVVDMISWAPVRDLRDMSDTLQITAAEILEETKRSLKDSDLRAARIGGGNDIMSVLVKSNMKASGEDKMSDEELMAHISSLTFAAMDTSSNAICKILHILSEHPEAQEKLRKEVRAAFAEHGGDLDYETLTNLPYLDAVCRESLRTDPPLPTVFREARGDGVIKTLRPAKSVDGKDVHEIFVPKGTLMLVSLHHCNRDPAIWGPDAAEWKPERWLSPLSGAVAEAHVPGVYSHLMTFLGGGRSCIGFKFAQLELKVVLSVLIEKFQFEPSDEKIIWMSNGINQPTIEDRETKWPSKKLQFPCKVSLAQQ